MGTPGPSSGSGLTGPGGSPVAVNFSRMARERETVATVSRADAVSAFVDYATDDPLIYVSDDPEKRNAFLAAVAMAATEKQCSVISTAFGITVRGKEGEHYVAVVCSEAGMDPIDVLTVVDDPLPDLDGFLGDRALVWLAPTE